jgi:hypothetical protein
MTNMNGYIAIEEAIAIPGLAERRPPVPLPGNTRTEFFDHVMARLPDVSRFRLPDMDASGVAMQDPLQDVQRSARPGQVPVRHVSPWDALRPGPLGVLQGEGMIERVPGEVHVIRHPRT